MKIVQILAPERPISDYVEDGRYELRLVVDRQQHRVLYCFHRRTIVATHAFLKKTRRIPSEEIARAKRARADWLAREAK